MPQLGAQIVEARVNMALQIEQSIDDVSQAIDPAAAYNDLVTFIFNADNEIVNVSWTVQHDPSLEAFHDWAYGKSTTLPNSDICDPAAVSGDGTACALEFQSFIDDYLAEQ